jgi:cobalt-zinc-cadmium efflux system membrane fusion protein
MFRHKNLASVSAPSGGYVKYTKYARNARKQRRNFGNFRRPTNCTLQQDYLLAKSNLSYARKDYTRQNDLNKSKAASDKVTQQAQTEAQNQNIMMRGMAENSVQWALIPKI